MQRELCIYQFSLCTSAPYCHCLIKKQSQTHGYLILGGGLIVFSSFSGVACLCRLALHDFICCLNKLWVRLIGKSGFRFSKSKSGFLMNSGLLFPNYACACKTAVLKDSFSNPFSDFPIKW